MEIKVNTVSIAALVYMYLGVVFFFIGWLKTGYALAACLILGAGFLAGARSWCQAGADDKVHLSKGTLLMGAALILFFVWHTGIGAFTGQAGDWAKHNAVMHDLMKKTGRLCIGRLMGNPCCLIISVFTCARLWQERHWVPSGRRNGCNTQWQQ